ncbi:flippase [Halocella sp. SP3-1]|uniref:flippase n=1 Tax=Halocella sp. SP3-1 TaxID=2382161 RepID=UPI000F756B96|nr:flippase [Halocella sp. SP3-1]AZO93473.1 flippase [Halocella sp. SP3-1]
MSDLYKKVSGTFLLKIIGLSIGFIFQIILGRMLGPEMYGKYTMYLTYTVILSIISVFGMDQNLIKEIPKYIESKNKAGSYLKLSLLISVLITIILSGSIFLINQVNNFGFEIYILIIMLFIKTIITIIDGFLQGIGLVVRVTFLNIVANNLLKMIGFFIMIYFGIDPFKSALYVFILSELITLIVRMSVISKFLNIKNNSKVLTKHEKIAFIKYSITVALIAGIGLLIQSIDKIMISTLIDMESVGLYKVAQNYVSLISVFIAPFIAFWPVISKLYHDNQIKEIEIEMKKIVTIIIYLVTPMFFLFLYLSDELLLIFGTEYATNVSKQVLIILSLSFLIDAISGPIGSILTMTKYAKYILYNNILSLILNLVLNYILIKNYGIVGVAIGTGISVIVSNLLSIIEVKLLLGIFSYDGSNIIQTIGLIGLNIISCIFIEKSLNVNNEYLYIISFGLVLYTINGLAIYLFRRNEINNLLDEWRV